MPAKMLKEIKDVLNEKELSVSLRLTRFAHLDETGSAPIDWACRGKTEKWAGFQFNAGKPVPMRLMGRLIMDQAGGVMENANLRLDRHFSCPYIPGSAVKGAARHAAWCAWHDEEDNEKKKEIARKLAMTFGYPTGDTMPKKEKDRKRAAETDYLDNYLAKEFPEQFSDEKAPYKTFAGMVSFLPAYPAGDYKLVTDVLTCHHMDYYSGKQNKAYDNENPNPQFFPAVEEGTTFKFRLLPIQRYVQLDFDSLAFAEAYVREGLEIYGIGAKTAAGYGWFEEVEDEEN